MALREMARDDLEEMLREEAEDVFYEDGRLDACVGCWWDDGLGGWWWAAPGQTGRSVGCRCSVRMVVKVNCVH